MSDIEIARNAKLKDIREVAKDMGLNEEEIESYGKYKAKITEKAFERLKDKKDRKTNTCNCNKSNSTWRRKNYNVNWTCRWVKKNRKKINTCT